MGKQRTPQGRAPGRKSPPLKTPVDALQAALPTTVPDAATLQTDPLTRSIAQAIHEPQHLHMLDTVSSEAVAHAPPEAAEVRAEAAGPVPADANLSAAPVSEAVAAPQELEIAPVAAAAPVVEAEAAIADAEHPAETAPAPLPEAAELSAAPAEPPAASDPYANVVPLKAPAPVAARAPEPALPAEPAAPPAASHESPLPAPASWRAGRRAGVAVRHDLEGMGETLFAFVRNESSAALAHLAALKDVRSPADAIRLQVSEIQRAADASLTCWSEIARRATRIVAPR